MQTITNRNISGISKGRLLICKRPLTFDTSFMAARSTNKTSLILIRRFFIFEVLRRFVAAQIVYVLLYIFETLITKIRPTQTRRSFLFRSNPCLMPSAFISFVSMEKPKQSKPRPDKYEKPLKTEKSFEELIAITVKNKKSKK